ncbi:metallophosphoesterase family protein [Roseibium aggregatum]|uniref:hypothetical protein n=1 Tax=Roseibium aggregatum TaxID=187304 RepID=UPI00389919EC
MGLSLEEDHEVILSQSLETLMAERADVLVIAGDVFDRASPPNSSIRQFNRFLNRVASTGAWHRRRGRNSACAA